MTDKKKSKATYHYFKGTARWTNFTTVDQYGNYSVNFEFEDDTELEKFKESGISAKMLADGKSTFFKRPPQKIFGDELVKLGPPEIVDNDGLPITDLVGAGSKVTVKVKAFPTPKGKGHELIAVQVNDLVKVEGRGKYNF